MSSVKVLLVEDDEILAEVYMLKFELESLEVKHAANGAEALTCLNDFRPDVILLDLMMPVMDGWEFMSKLKQTDRSPRIIVFSNMLSKENKVRAAKLGAARTWVKSDYTPDLAVQQILEICR